MEIEPSSIVTITDYENFEDIHFNKDWVNNEDWNFTVDDVSCTGKQVLLKVRN